MTKIYNGHGYWVRAGASPANGRRRPRVVLDLTGHDGRPFGDGMWIDLMPRRARDLAAALLRAADAADKKSPTRADGMTAGFKAIYGGANGKRT